MGTIILASSQDNSHLSFLGGAMVSITYRADGCLVIHFPFLPSNVKLYSLSFSLDTSIEPCMGPSQVHNNTDISEPKANRKGEK